MLYNDALFVLVPSSTAEKSEFENYVSKSLWCKFHSGEIPHNFTNRLNIARFISCSQTLASQFLHYSLQNKDHSFLITNNICTVKLTMQLSSFSLGTLVQSVFNTHGNLVMIRSSILQEIAAKSSYFSSAETCFNSNTLH